MASRRRKLERWKYKNARRKSYRKHHPAGFIRAKSWRGVTDLVVSATQRFFGRGG